MNKYKLRHEILSILYKNQEESGIITNQAWDVAQSLSDLVSKLDQEEAKVKRELHYLTARKILHVMALNGQTRWFLRKVEVYLGDVFLHEEQKARFERFKRRISYFTLSIGLLITLSKTFNLLPKLFSNINLTWGIILVFFSAFIIFFNKDEAE